MIAEFFMLILYHLTGRLLPARFFLFGAVGVTGVAVHLAVLTAAFHATGGNFLASQALATWAAMTSNFFLNNAFTYGDQRLRGAAVWRGLFSFYIACGIGALINLAVAEWLYLQSVAYWIAGVSGALIAAIWNFFTTASVTWGRADGGGDDAGGTELRRLAPTGDRPPAWRAALFALYALTAPRTSPSRTTGCSSFRAISSASSIRPASRSSR